MNLFGLNFYSKNIDWDKLNEELSRIDWTTEVGNTNKPSEVLKSLLSVLLSICRKHVPAKVWQKRKVYIPRYRRVLMRKRRKLRSKYKQAKLAQKEKLLKEMEITEAKLLESHHKEARSRENKAVGLIKENTKYFFKYAKSKSHIHSSIGPLEHIMEG